MWYTDDLTPLTKNDIVKAAQSCSAYRIFLHWSAGRYGQAFEDYHINIDEDGGLYCVGDLDFDELREHTWKRNTGSIGISLCCGYGAVANNGYDADFGDYPPTKAQIDTMGWLVAVICKNSHINIDDTSILTHKEVACIDGYGVPHGTYVDGVWQGDPDLRWDLWYLPDFDGEMRPGGQIIRGKARFYYDFV